MSEQSEQPNPDICLRPGCGKAQHTRGLCPSCYQAARRLVHAKKVTWPALERAGKAIPKLAGSNGWVGVTDWLMSGLRPDVIIDVSGGVAECTYSAPGINVKIVDHDNEKE